MAYFGAAAANEWWRDWEWEKEQHWKERCAAFHSEHFEVSVNGLSERMEHEVKQLLQSVLDTRLAGVESSALTEEVKDAKKAMEELGTKADRVSSGLQTDLEKVKAELKEVREQLQESEELRIKLKESESMCEALRSPSGLDGMVAEVSSHFIADSDATRTELEAAFDFEDSFEIATAECGGMMAEDELSKRLNQFKAEAEVRFATMERQHKALNDQIWGDELSLAKVADELKKTNATFSKLEDAVAALREGKAEAVQLEKLRADVVNDVQTQKSKTTKAFNRAYQDFKSMRSDMGDLKLQFSKVVNDMQKDLASQKQEMCESTFRTSNEFAALRAEISRVWSRVWKVQEDALWGKILYERMQGSTTFGVRVTQPFKEDPREKHLVILGLPRTATWPEVKQAYKKAALQCHPDKGGSADVFRRVAAAYKALESLFSSSERRSS